MVVIPPSARRATRDVVGSSDSFSKLGISDSYRRALLLAGYKNPSPVQETAIPLARLGSDLIVQAKSGTGKTLVFALACIERVQATHWYPQALIISPTREIAQQNATEIQKIANNLPFPNLNCVAFTGGVSVNEDRRRLLRPCQVIIGTPGRLLWLMQKNLLNLDGIRVVVLDEADQLANESLWTDTQHIVSLLPTARQSLAFSATYNFDSLPLLESIMDYPQQVIIKESEKPLIGVKQCYKLISPQVEEDKIFESKTESLLELFQQVSFHQAVVFCNSKCNGELLVEKLNCHGFPSSFTAGCKSQDHRNQTFHGMRDFELRVVVSTDLYARGVDLERVNLVVNLDLPITKETYKHRVGRTGRFGSHGISVALVTSSEKERLEEYCQAEDSTVLLPLPREIPVEWYEQKLNKQTDQMAYQKLLETPVVPETRRHFEQESQTWIGNLTSTDFSQWKEGLEKKNTFWKYWDPYQPTANRPSTTSQASREVSCSPSELSLRSGASSKKSNCIRLPMRLSRTTSTSSVVYSEEGDCEIEDENYEIPIDSEHNLETSEDDDFKPYTPLKDESLGDIEPPPCPPPELSSVSDFMEMKEKYERWRREYMSWHENYNQWYEKVKTKIEFSDHSLISTTPSSPAPEV